MLRICAVADWTANVGDDGRLILLCMRAHTAIWRRASDVHVSIDVGVSGGIRNCSARECEMVSGSIRCPYCWGEGCFVAERPLGMQLVVACGEVERDFGVSFGDWHLWPPAS